MAVKKVIFSVFTKARTINSQFLRIRCVRARASISLIYEVA